jgi:hypothetical protein
MKFLCIPCDEPMQLVERGAPDASGSMSVVFTCPRCAHAIAMLTNAAETQLVNSLGVHIGVSAAAPAAPLQHLRTGLAQMRADASGSEAQADEPVWTAAALERLNGVPRFIQPMIRQAYTDYARQHGISEITPEVMDAARHALGMK